MMSQLYSCLTDNGIAPSLTHIQQHRWLPPALEHRVRPFNFFLLSVFYRTCANQSSNNRHFFGVFLFSVRRRMNEGGTMVV